MSDPFLGEIKMLASNYAPVGYAFCLGQVLPISQNDPLYSLIGNLYGGVAGISFALPDFRGRSPVGAGTSKTGSEFQLGQSGGNETVTLSAMNMPPHHHTVMVSTQEATSHDAKDAYLSAANDGNGNSLCLYGTSDAGIVALNDKTITSVGANLSVYVQSPYLALSFVIALTGAYPVRS